MTPTLEQGFLPATRTRLQVKRNGHSLLRSQQVPKPTILIDTRERQPWPLFASHRNWIGGEVRATLKCGDYSAAGMEGLLALERKSLADLVDCTITSRARFLACCQRLEQNGQSRILINSDGL